MNKPTYDELAAQVEKLRGGLNEAIELLVTALHEPQQITESEIHDLRTLEKSTPAQCLAEIKAQAVEDAFNYAREKCKTYLDFDFYVMEYANQLRQQAKAGA